MLTRRCLALAFLAAAASLGNLSIAQSADIGALSVPEASRALIELIEAVPESEHGGPGQAQLVDELGKAVAASALADLNSPETGSRSERIERLRQTLAKLPQKVIRLDPPFTGAPFVMTADSLAGHTVFASFTVVWGGAGAPYLTHWIWAFQERNGKFEVVDRAGEDLSDAGLFIEPLPAGRTGEQWFLAWGVVSGANQTPLRTRVFAFDGERFATLWSPPNYAQQRIRRTADGFETRYWDPVQRYQLHQAPYVRYERYVMTVQGVFQQESYLTDEIDFLP